MVAGYVALYSSKGAPLHRRAGLTFVYAILVMCVFAMVLAIGSRAAPALNVPAALLTAALVITALTTVRASSAITRALDTGAMLVALGVGLATLTFAFEAITSPTGLGRDDMPVFPFLMFGVVGTLAALGDVKVLRLGATRGPSRVARHLWRMSFALFVAALSFFIGQADVFPRSIRIRPILALPVLAVLLTMFYWLWRVRIRRSLHGLVGRQPL